MSGKLSEEEVTEGLKVSLAEVNQAADAMVAHLIWFTQEGRDHKVQRLADEGHEPSKHLVILFALWYTEMTINPKGFVEETHKMVKVLDEYRAAGYVV